MAGGPKSECPQSSEDPYEDAKSPKRRATETAKTERKPVGAGIPNRKSCREMPKKSVTPKGGDLGTITYEEGTRRNKGSCEKTQEHEPTPSKPMFRFDGLRRKIEDLRKKNKRKSQSSNDLPPNMSRERFDFSREKPSNMNTMADRTVQEHEFTEAPAPAEQKSKEEKKHVCKEAAPNTEREKGDPYEDKASVRQGTNKRPYVKMNDMENKSLSRLEWYHGYMPREEIEELLKKDGEFCLRKTDVGNNERYAVSVFWGDHVRHILPRLNNENKWTIRDVAFEKVERLLIFYITSKAELQPCGTKLLKPFHRPDWYILHEHVTLKKKLGSGNFGDVFLAELCDTKSGKIPVAVKTLRGKLKKNERAQFVKEASMMRRFNHENIVRILGVAPQQEPIMILLELASGGCLKSHCRDKAELTVSQLSNYCLDAAKGMEYLSSQLVIHRDIAARNCLLGANDVVKISDFGLSVANHNEVKESVLRNVPVKWLAPETLMKGVFTTKSDVWSFGVMMWEVYSRCKRDPYPGMTNKDTRAMVLTDGRMEPPPEMTKGSADIMKNCWKKNPEERPDWQEIVRRLSDECGVKPPIFSRGAARDGPALPNVEEQYFDPHFAKPGY